MSVLINSIVLSSGIMEYIERCILVNNNTIINLDYRVYMVYIVLQKCFFRVVKKLGWYQQSNANPTKNRHMEKFLESIKII